MGLAVVARFVRHFRYPYTFREAIKRCLPHWLRLPVEQALPKFFIGTILTCILAALVRISLVDAFGFLSLARQSQFHLQDDRIYIRRRAGDHPLDIDPLFLLII